MTINRFFEALVQKTIAKIAKMFLKISADSSSQKTIARNVCKRMSTNFSWQITFAKMFAKECLQISHDK
jgi:hypothetical protein